MSATTTVIVTPESSWLLLVGLLSLLFTAGWVGWHLAMLRVERMRDAVAERHGRQVHDMHAETVRGLARLGDRGDDR